MSQKRKRSPEPAPATQNASIFCSSPIEDRSSTFIAYFSPSLKPKELQNIEEIKTASHKMLAWRRESNQQSITGGVKYTTDHDDDGEKYGGKRIEQVLESLQVSGSCVVARWYSGVLLGPVRFAHIETCARQAVRNWQDTQAEEQSKRKKLESDLQDVARLSEILDERDQSISVLRTLAAEKEDMVKQAKVDNNLTTQKTENSEAANAKLSTPAPRPPVDYSAMPIDRLRALEKARDATLSFLLKRIDKSEAELTDLQKA